MIEVKNLRKEYKVGNNVQVALNELSFTLPSNGMVFVLGESGSGKTTLMNLIGGLDSPTSGQIIVDGNEISSFSELEYEEYRNSHVGFIFQDFFLLESCTVSENVSLSLRLQNKNDDELVRKTLTMVDLNGLENRYPSEISGGQKQRVAIARAIVKNPYLILADEPTGNLDYRTSAQILNLLQELSKDRLVLIVSHNKEEAYKYADVLIKIDKGNVTNIYTRSSSNEDGFIEDNKIIFPYNVKLSNEELQEINEYAKTGNYLLTQSSNRFIPGLNIEIKDTKREIKKTKLKRSSSNYFSKKLQEGNVFSSILTSVMVSIMIVLIMICFAFSNYDGTSILNHVNQYNEQSSFMIQRGYYDLNVSNKIQNNITNIPVEEINQFYEKGYTGNIYKLYNRSNILGTNVYTTTLDSKNVYYNPSTTHMYELNGRGVLDCDIDYLVKKYGDSNGHINVLAGSLEDGFKDNGYVITDYVADCIMHMYVEYKNMSKEEAYPKIVESPNFNNKYTVKAIIYTGYTERYKEIIDVYAMKNDIQQMNKYSEKLTELQNKEIYFQFLNELNSSLLISYYIGEEDFYESLLSDYMNTTRAISVPRAYFDVSGGDGTSFYNTKSFQCAEEEQTINTGEVIVSYQIYNYLFGTNMKPGNTDGFEEKEITLRIYDQMGKEGGNVILTKKFKIIGVETKKHDVYYLNMGDFEEVMRVVLAPYALLFDNTESITSIYNTQDELFHNYYFVNTSYDSVFETVSILKAFKDIFFILLILLAVGSIIIMSGQINKNVKKKTYEIGVLKGIGLKSSVVTSGFAMSLVLFIGIIISIVSIALIFVEDLLNSLLTVNLATQMPENLLKGMKVLQFNPIIVASTYVFIVLIGAFTTFVLLRSLKKIKPIEIIKSKEL